PSRKGRGRSKQPDPGYTWDEEDILARRGDQAKHIAKLAVARQLLTWVFYAMRDGQVRDLAAAVVGVAVAGAGGGFGPGGAGGGGRVRQGPVRPLVVAAARDGVPQGLEPGEAGRLDGLGGQPVLQGLLDPPGLALILGVAGPPVVLLDAPAAQLVREGVAAARAARQPGGAHHPVARERCC